MSAAEIQGRSMLVTAIMDIVTSNCDAADKMSFQPSLSANAEMRDIAAAIQVIEEGSMHLEEWDESEEDDDGGKGIKGIGMKVLGGTTILGLSRTSGVMKLTQSHNDYSGSIEENLGDLVYHKKKNGSVAQTNFSSSVIPGLWDDLHCQHVAVPFAAWALANWAVASDMNRLHIQELDQDGQVVMSALMAPERSVKWHGSLVARSLLGDYNLPLTDSVSDWSSSLLSTIFQASKNEDMSLARVALSAFLLSIERSDKAQKVVMEKGLERMREATKRTRKHVDLQESFAKVLELLCSKEMHLSLEEGQKWSAILLPWIFGHMSSESIRDSATKILSRILEDYGPYSVPISQGWLAMILNEVLTSDKRLKGTAQVQSDKVKTQIDQSNLVSAGQIANQLVNAVVNLAGKQMLINPDSDDPFPLTDLLSLDPFAVQFKNLKKDNLPKLDAADSAIATLKGVKSLAEVCADDSSCQNKLLDWGIVCLLRRLLLRDDYEKLAAFEAYDASSRVPEARERGSNAPGDASRVATNDSSSVRVPPTAHIRRHAARLFTILSVLPNAQKVIAADKTLCKWLDDCAKGKIPGCTDLKLQSYARATLLNVFCCYQVEKTSNSDSGSESGSASQNVGCHRYGDMIFLINPEMAHWKCLGKPDIKTANANQQYTDSDCVDMSSAGLNKCSEFEDPLVDVIFVHGLRGGPYKTWRISEDKSSTKSGLVEKIDKEAGVQGTFWPGEWLPYDLNQARLFTLKYKTNLTQWSGASLPLQEVSSMLLEKLIDAGIGDRPVVFVTHSMGGLVVKQLLYKAREQKLDNLVKNTVGVVFYSCPHFGSKLADMPWRMGYVLRPAPSIGELRSGSERLVELNDFFRQLHKRGQLNVLSFCETKVTPIVEGYGGWAFRMEIVPIESAYPGYGELIVLESTDHINSCKPLSRSDPSYTETLNFLNKLKAQLSSDSSCR
uniref:Protein SERAC1 n=1 Tax=Kalanchoe fedtschenkoi TaxID=63787 RepID=A0A7N0SXP7_KALFE